MMEPAAASHVLQLCIEQDRVIVTEHFHRRLVQRGLFWSDLLTIIEKPSAVRADGVDKFRRERWFFSGRTVAALAVEFLCAIDASDPLAVFITIYWK